MPKRSKCEEVAKKIVELCKGCSDGCIPSESAIIGVISGLGAATKEWRCFFCDFVTSDIKQAAAHFGDRDDAEEFKPICKWWAQMDDSERREALQDVIQQKNDAEAALLELERETRRETLLNVRRNFASTDHWSFKGWLEHELAELERKAKEEV